MKYVALATINAEAAPDVSGAALLDDVHAFVGRFVAYPSAHAHAAHVLWIVHAHLVTAFFDTPRLAFLSPEPASGKSRALEITGTLVPRPINALNASSAYLFRRVSSDDGLPALLLDEIDAVFGPKAKEHEDLRAFINAGHRRGQVVGRCVMIGRKVETEDFPAFCAVALAGLGDLPDTILSRSVIVRMRKRAPSEHVEPYRPRDHEAQGHRIRDRLAAWANTVATKAEVARPPLPPGIVSRDADVWEPLIIVADLAGGAWPLRARNAAVAMVAEAQDRTPSLGMKLLGDLRQVFGDRPAIATTGILDDLCRLDESPWADLRGKPLDARGLAKLLRQYGIKSKSVRIGTETPKGYAREDLHDAWQRYLNPSPLPLSPGMSATCATSATGNAD